MSTGSTAPVSDSTSFIEVSTNDFCLCLTRINQNEYHKAIHGPQTSISQFACTVLPAIISFQSAAPGLVVYLGWHSLKERLTIHEVFQRPLHSMPSTKWAFDKCHLVT